MTVVFKGGTSGCREDYLANTPDSGSAQPILRTQNQSTSSNVQFCQNSGNSEGDVSPPMPTGASIPEDSTDVRQQDIVRYQP